MRILADTNILFSALLFPESLPAAVLAHLPCEIIAAPAETGARIADAKDQPILNAAVFAGVDIVVSGDRHFLNLDLERPRTMSPARFRDEFLSPDS